jgi:hypothetical protein
MPSSSLSLNGGPSHSGAPTFFARRFAVANDTASATFTTALIKMFNKTAISYNQKGNINLKLKL